MVGSTSRSHPGVGVASVAGARYRLVVNGEVSPRYATAFEGMEVESHNGVTVISGTITDQAHLHGLLDRVASLGMTLISVSRENGTAEA